MIVLKVKVSNSVSNELFLGFWTSCGALGLLGVLGFWTSWQLGNTSNGHSYVNFTKKVTESSKSQLNNLYQKIKKDCRSTTGKNIRRIENIFNGKRYEEIDRDQIKKKEYFPITQENKWRLPIVKELTDVKFNQLSIQGFTRSEIKDMLLDICTT